MPDARTPQRPSQNLSGAPALFTPGTVPFFVDALASLR